MTNEQIFLKAQSDVALRRQKAVTLMLKREEEILKAFPELEQLKAKRLKAGINAARASLAGAESDGAKKALDALKAVDGEISELLKSNNIDENALLPQYFCKLCGDTGRFGGEVCECVIKMANELRRSEVAKSSPLSLCSFDNFSLLKYSDKSQNGHNPRECMQGIYEYCRQYADDFSKNSESLYLCGSAGLGKTHLALSIANVVLQKGYNIIYTSAQNAFAAIERERFMQNNNSTLDSILTAELLIMDDLGTEHLTPFVGSCLYDIVNTRWNKKLPTIYTSNFIKMDELAKRYTEKIVSRLMGSCEVLYCTGDDIRLQSK